MRLKLDESMPRPSAEMLRSACHDVHTAADEGLLGNKTIVAPAIRAVALATDIDMKGRVAIFDDERIRLRPPLVVVHSQERS
jgi:hypothetical protein